MVVMGRKEKGNYCHRQKDIAKFQIDNKKDIFDNVNLMREESKSNLQDKYKEILGSRKPIVILNDCLRTMCKIISTNLKNNTKKNTMKKNLTKSTIHKKRKPEQKLPLNDDIQASKFNPKLKKRKSKKLILSTKALSPDSWQIKNDVDLKAKALKDSKNLKVCLEKITYLDKNLYDIGKTDKPKMGKKNYVKKRVKNTQVEEKHKRTIKDKVKKKQKRSTSTNFNVTKDKKSYSSGIDCDSFSHSAIDFSNAIFPTNYAVNMKTPSTINNQLVKETNDCCMSTGEEERNVQNLVCESLDENVKTRSLPIVIREDILHKHSILLNVKASEASENNNESLIFYNNNNISNGIIFREFDFSQTVSRKNSQNVIHVNECLEINEKGNSDLKTNNVISKMQVKNIDFDKNTNYGHGINAPNNEHYSTLGNNVKNFSCNIQNKNSNLEWKDELDKENNKNTSSSTQSFLSEDHVSYNAVNAINNSKKEYLTVEKSLNAFNNNSASRYVQDRVSIDTQNVTEDAKNISQDIDNDQAAKRIKLDRNHWCKSVTNACKMKENVDSSNNIVLGKGDAMKKYDEPKSKIDEIISDLIKQNETKNVKDIDVQDNNSLNINKSEEVVSNIYDSSMETKCSISGSVHNSDDGSDYISLFADSAIIDEYDTVVKSDSCEKIYHMTDTSFDNYYKKNKIEFNQIYENNDVINISKKTNCLSAITVTSTRTYAMVHQSPLLMSAFRGHCYKFISSGECLRNNCTFKHNFLLTMDLLYRNDEQYFFEVLKELALKNFIIFIEKVVLEIMLYASRNIVYILKILKKLYELKSITNKMIIGIIQWLKTNSKTLKVVSNTLETIVNKYDFNFVNWMLGVLQRATECGAYWDTFRNLLIQTKYLEPQIIEKVLRECIITKKHLQDININIIQKLNTNSCSEINKDLLLTFDNLIKSENNSEVKQDALTESISSINSATNTNSKTFHQNNNSDKTDTENGNNTDTHNENSGYRLHPIDNLARPYSVHGRKKFWKFYIDVYSLQQGLENNDYDHVMKILNSVKETEQSVFTCACYQILCNEIMHSQYHLSKLIVEAVRIGSTGVLYQMLLDIAICILAYLAENSLWVLAHTLLKDVYIMLKSNINLYQFNAATIMLFAEIYLANQQPVEALTLFKQCNIIFTNRSKWKVQSTRKDDYTRSQIITLLLDALCTMFPEHAFFLFQFLIADQYSNFYPIDLTDCANKIVSVLLSKENHELIIEVGRLIDSYYFTLDAITYRALIATLVHSDMFLAKQLYQNAVALGIYSKPQFHPVIHLIINSDWTREEMFLAITDLMKQLLSNIGHAIDRISPRQLSVYLIFENISLEKQVNYDTETSHYYNEKIRRSKILMRNLLKEKFDPPITVSHCTTGKICKLINKSVLAYLQSEHYE
ncbi:uncharacterized protein LOC105662543 [Megachile rotundata]|uniref:uncharacterized protein LOC105662543 n=1 Tax=Megachile rotundata TaxID=143995 RepID=UPI003FCFDEFE